MKHVLVVHAIHDTVLLGYADIKDDISDIHLCTTRYQEHRRQ